MKLTFSLMRSSHTNRSCGKFHATNRLHTRHTRQTRHTHDTTHTRHTHTA
jgi:hypothetical protein